MNYTILTKEYAAPPFCHKEILRYSGCKSSDSEIESLINWGINEASDNLVYKVCYCILPVNAESGFCDFGAFKLKSEKLAQNLHGCTNAVVFAATVGIGIDRLISKYSRISPSRALILNSIGTERTESLCDAFCNDIASTMALGTKPRFSPGYGDLSIYTQADIFSFLECSKRIGLFLTDTMLMSPSKSVTAIMGLTSEKNNPAENKCSRCDNADCSFRGTL